MFSSFWFNVQFSILSGLLPWNFFECGLASAAWMYLSNIFTWKTTVYIIFNNLNKDNASYSSAANKREFQWIVLKRQNSRQVLLCTSYNLVELLFSPFWKRPFWQFNVPQSIHLSLDVSSVFQIRGLKQCVIFCFVNSIL